MSEARTTNPVPSPEGFTAQGATPVGDVVRASGFPTLPDGWSEGLSDVVRRRVILAEAIPAEDLVRRLGAPMRHERGYVRLQLGRGHPYANSGGQQFLHRYLMCRKLRRALLSCEHVHHAEREDGTLAPKNSTNVDDFELMLDENHGHYHWHWHGPCECKTRALSPEEAETEAQVYADKFEPIEGAF